MNVEFSGEHKEVSEAEWIHLKEGAWYWRGLVRERRDSGGVGVSRSYNHILNNLCAALTLVIETADDPVERKDEWYGDALDAINYIKRYFELLGEFPEFAEKELKPGGGYFPELMGRLAGSKAFIDEYEKRLKGNNEPKGETHQ
jgi:hypothetical protein